MEKLNVDELFLIALELELPDLLRFCASNKEIDNVVCKRNDIWLTKLSKEFPDRNKLKNGPKNFKDIYILLWNLNDLKHKLNLKIDIYTLYSLKSLYINITLKELPSSIKFLNNLEILTVESQLVKFPDLPASLKTLDVYNNKLVKLPNVFPPYLSNLDVSYNKIVKLPDDIPSSLKYLYVKGNPLLPGEIERIRKSFPNLKITAD